MLFRQLFDSDSSSYTYLVADSETREAVIIDPVAEHIEEYLRLLGDIGCRLAYSLETHVHADHITAGGLLRQRTNARTGVSQGCGAATADLQLRDRDALEFGRETIRVLATPGHTPGSVSFLWRDRVFTGDALLINGCGRTDFQGGDPAQLYDSITRRLFTLPDDTLVYPAHDYHGKHVTTIAQEKGSNARIAGKTREQFVALMEQLNLPRPDMMDAAVSANRYCGLPDEKVRQDERRSAYGIEDLVDEARRDIREIDVRAAQAQLADSATVIIDVREPHEYESASLPGAINIPRGVLETGVAGIEALRDRTRTIIMYCGTGRRSALAAQTLKRLGYTGAVSLAGGIEAWRAGGGPIAAAH